MKFVILPIRQESVEPKSNARKYFGAISVSARGANSAPFDHVTCAEVHHFNLKQCTRRSDVYGNVHRNVL